MIIDPYSWRDAVIVDRIQESTEAVSLCIETDDDYVFFSGQHAIVRVALPSGIKLIRQYSFASSPISGEIWFTVVREPYGVVSGWLTNEAEIGESIEISQPFTGPLRQELPYKNVGMIAGGSGIVPIMSHIRSIRLQANQPNVHLLYSTKRDKECYIEELSSVYESETIDVVRSDVSGRFITSAISILAEESDALLLCGSHKFVNDISLQIKQIHPDLPIFTEAFSL